MKTVELPSPERRQGLTINDWDVFLHNVPAHASYSWWWIQHAERVYAGNTFIAKAVESLRPDAQPLWCPSTVHGTPTRGSINVWTFGMAHKAQLPLFERLKFLLEHTTDDYTVCSSMGIHEGQSWDDGFLTAQREMQALFGDHLRFLGFLADDALSVAIREAQMVALFYDPALRANHTTAWAVLERGTPLITNLDADSPVEARHEANVFDINELEGWPTADERRIIRAGGARLAEAYRWEKLIGRLQEAGAQAQPVGVEQC